MYFECTSMTMKIYGNWFLFLKLWVYGAWFYFWNCLVHGFLFFILEIIGLIDLDFHFWNCFIIEFTEKKKKINRKKPMEELANSFNTSTSRFHRNKIKKFPISSVPNSLLQMLKTATDLYTKPKWKFSLNLSHSLRIANAVYLRIFTSAKFI